MSQRLQNEVQALALRVKALEATVEELQALLRAMTRASTQVAAQKKAS